MPSKRVVHFVPGGRGGTPGFPDGEWDGFTACGQPTVHRRCDALRPPPSRATTIRHRGDPSRITCVECQVATEFNVIDGALRPRGLVESFRAQDIRPLLDFTWNPRRFDGLRVVGHDEVDVDLRLPVWVYRNVGATYRDDPEPTYSIRQRGRVVAHASAVMLAHARFIVDERGRQRVLRTGHKNVHAFVVGMLVADGQYGIRPEDFPNASLAAGARYNPHEFESFIDTRTGTALRGASGVLLNKHGVTYCYGAS